MTERCVCGCSYPDRWNKRAVKSVSITLDHEHPYDPEFVRATFAMFFAHGDRIQIDDVRWI